jgi:hypothetical protein
MIQDKYDKQDKLLTGVKMRGIVISDGGTHRKNKGETMTNEYMSRMEALANEINSGEMQSNICVGIALNPPTVEWYAYENMQGDCDQYDALFFVESLTSDESWDGASLAEYLEMLTHEFMAENE